MPEGHTVHRTAGQFKKHFVGKPIQVSSPQGRFTDSALISGSKLLKAEAWGKQLFLTFEPAVLRIHLGIYGKWGWSSFEDQPKDPWGQVRARFLSETQVADLRGPTACELLDSESVKLVTSKLGPDPLRPDPKGLEKARFIERVARSKVAIGQLLMDQSVLAGVGNVYRAELLFRAKVNPHNPGAFIPPELVAAIWDDAVALMEIGVKRGIMLTRDGYLKGQVSKANRYYTYKREGLPCRECGHGISIELMATRKLYWCAACQN
jgi:endonuclease VIII